MSEATTGCKKTKHLFSIPMQSFNNLIIAFPIFLFSTNMLVQSANANKPVHVQMYNCLLEVGSQNKFVIRACHWARTNCGSFFIRINVPCMGFPAVCLRICLWDWGQTCPCLLENQNEQSQISCSN